MRLIEAAEPVFARHETFHPRYGWFRKAYASVGRDPKMFTRKDAPIQLGVGKNMVRAIRFWGTAAKVIQASSGSRRSRFSIMGSTFLGDKLFGEGGWDPYMEEPATLWLLHWLLLAPPCHLPVWWLAFNEFHAVEFDDGELEQVVLTQLEVTGWRMPHTSSVRKDVRALLRTYTPASPSTRAGIDDILDCPLRELRLIGRSEATGRYRFATRATPSLPAAVVTFAALDYVARTNAGAGTVTISHLAQEPGGPGRAFKLTESDLRKAIGSVADDSSSIRLAAVAGVPQLSWSGSPQDTGATILDDYYRQPNRVSRTIGEKSA